MYQTDQETPLSISKLLIQEHSYTEEDLKEASGDSGVGVGRVRYPWHVRTFTFSSTT